MPLLLLICMWPLRVYRVNTDVLSTGTVSYTARNLPGLQALTRCDQGCCAVFPVKPYALTDLSF